MRLLIAVLFVVAVGACGEHQTLVSPSVPATPVVAAPVAPVATPIIVTVFSEKTRQTERVTIMSTDPEPPSCDWRDLVVRKHIELGGAKNDIVTLSNWHKVYIWDIGPGLYDYRLYDNPTDWCLR